MTSPDGRSPLARASEWATRIMTVSLEMVLPGLAGYWLDQKLHTVALFMLIGFALGGTAAVVHLLHLTRESDEKRQSASGVEHEKRNEIS
jgi:F0F1-type ATP synthase assembly protein I